MSQPVAYSPVTTFVTYQATQSWFPGQNIDVELNNLKTTTDQVRANLALVQRDDGALANSIVTYASLSPALQTAGLQPLTLWKTGTVYGLTQVVLINYTLYQCAVAHTSGVFATDLNNGLWTLLSPLAALTASAQTLLGLTVAQGDTIYGVSAGAYAILGKSASASQFLSNKGASNSPSWAQPAASDVSGLATSATTDTTNATNITSGTLAAARLPNPTASTLGGIESYVAVSNQWINAISTSGVPASTQPAFSNLSGAATSAQLPAPTLTLIGGVKAIAAVTHQWINSIDTFGVPALSQPAFTDVSGSVAAAQMPALTGDVTTVAGAVATTIAASAVTNAKTANMASYTLKGNVTAGAAAPTDFTIDGLTAKASPVAADELIIWDVAGAAIKKATVASISSAGSVASIAGNTGAFTLSNGVTNSTNDIRLDVSFLQNYLSGLTMSTAGSSTTLTVAVGVCADSTNAVLSKLGSATAKTTAAWVVGTAAGGLDTGAIANSTWYHFYIIERTDLTVTDVLFSLSASAPTMPANYTYKRRIGSAKTDGSGNWTAFTQVYDRFIWSAMVTNASSVATAADGSGNLITLTVPTGFNILALTRTRADYVSGAVAVLFTSPLESDQASGSALTSLTVSATLTVATGFQETITNTSAQIRERANGTGTTYSIVTYGWMDTRGK